MATVSKKHYNDLLEVTRQFCDNNTKMQEMFCDILDKWRGTIEINSELLAHLSRLESQNDMLIKQNNSLHEQLINMFPKLDPHIYATSIYDESNLQGETDND